jgi:hypothetical protein
MRLTGLILCVALASCPSVFADDETLKRIFADWKAIREVNDVYKFEYSFKRTHFVGTEKSPDIKGEFAIDWSSQEYQIQEWTTSTTDNHRIKVVEVYTGKMRSLVIWPIEADGTVGQAPRAADVSQGDFTATQFSQDLFPFLLAKRVVLSRPREMYRPGKLRFPSDGSLFYVHKRAGNLVTLNTYPTSAGPSRTFWQYDVDLGKQSSIRAMRHIHQKAGGGDAIFIEWQIEYGLAGADWVVTSWVERQYDVTSGKLMNRHDMKVIRFEKLSATPKFSHDIPEGHKVRSITYPDYNPSAKDHRIIEVVEYRRDQKSTESRWLVYSVWAGAILGFLALVVAARRHMRTRAA